MLHVQRFPWVPLAALVAGVSAACGVPSALDPTGPDSGSTAPLPEQPPGWDSEVALRTLPDLNPDPDVLEIELEARPQEIEYAPGRRVELWTYEGSLPGPLIRAKVGDRLIVHFTNHLPEETTIHWHGVRVPNEMDGTEEVQSPIPPGGTFRYEFDLIDPGTFWYHPHVRSTAQVGFGLYGPIVVDDPEEPFVGDDLVLVLSDLSIERDGSLSPGDRDGWFGDYFGREGGYLLVNGRTLPTVHARPGAPQRWRVINASRAAYHQFTIPGQALIRVGTDGGLAEKAVAVERITIPPGGRAELFVLPRPQAGPVTIEWEDSDRFNIGFARDPLPLLRFAVADEPAPDVFYALPETLREIPAIDVTNATVRRIELTEMDYGGVGVLGIDGVPSWDAEPLEAHLGATEIWEVTNSTGHDHPFHMHGFFFQVLDERGVPPAAREWRDTIDIDRKATLRFAVTYDRPGMWMFHCHILDHADLGMMGMLHVGSH